MTGWQKIVIGVIAMLAWVLAIVAKHSYADIDVSAVITMAQGVLIGLGVTHISTPTDVEPVAATPAIPRSVTEFTQMTVEHDKAAAVNEANRLETLRRNAEADALK